MIHNTYLSSLSMDAVVQVARMLDEERKREGYSSVAAIAPLLKELTLVMTVRNVDWRVLESAMSKTTAIETLQIEVANSLPLPLPRIAWESLLSSKLSNLSRLEIHEKMDAPAHVLDLVANSTRSLKSFAFRCKLGRGSIFLPLILANSNMTDVFIHEYTHRANKDTEEQVLCLASCLLSCFRRCRKLKKLNIKLDQEMPSETSMRDLLVPFRNRGVNVCMQWWLSTILRKIRH